MNRIQFITNAPLYHQYIDVSLPQFVYELNDLEQDIFLQLVTLSEQA